MFRRPGPTIRNFDKGCRCLFGVLQPKRPFALLYHAMPEFIIVKSMSYHNAKAVERATV